MDRIDRFLYAPVSLCLSLIIAQNIVFLCPSHIAVIYISLERLIRLQIDRTKFTCEHCQMNLKLHHSGHVQRWSGMPVRILLWHSPVFAWEWRCGRQDWGRELLLLLFFQATFCLIVSPWVSLYMVKYSWAPLTSLMCHSSFSFISSPPLTETQSRLLVNNLLISQ